MRVQARRSCAPSIHGRTAPAITQELPISTALAPILDDDATTEWLMTAQRIASLASRQRETLSDIQRVYRFLKLLSEGNYRETAIRSAGFAKQTLYDWLDYAKQGDLAAIALVDALEKAEADGEAEAVSHVRAAGKHPQFWAAAMTRLERKSPDRWGKRDEASVTAKVQVSIGGVSQAQVLVGVQVGGLSPDSSNDLAQLSTGQVRHEGLIIGDYVNPSEIVPALTAAPAAAESQIPAHGLPGVPGRQGEAPLAGRDGMRIKARARARQEKKEKKDQR